MFYVFFEYEIATILFVLVQIAVGEQWTLKQTCLSFLIWGKSWYIFAILCLYAFTFFAFKIVKKNYLAGIATIAVLTVLYIVIVKNFKSRFWYDTVMCYPLGMIYSMYKEKIEKFTADKLYKWCISIAIVSGLVLLAKVFGKNALISVIFGYLLIGILIVLITMRVSFRNKILDWCGKYAFEIFILHHIPMIVLNKTGLTEVNHYLSFGICIIVIPVLAYCFSKAYKKIWALIA